MGFNCGIIGLPNVGKSTLFNALTQSKKAEAANYPFATIEPNIGRVAIPDKRLEDLSNIANSEKTIPAYMDFVDIAGLVKGASKGEGLGNKFLANIREVDVIAHVVRCFEDENITHVSSSINPIDDIQTITTELMISDIEILENKKNSIEKKIKHGDKEVANQISLIEKILYSLNNEEIFDQSKFSKKDLEFINSLNLISLKPMLYVCNVDERSIEIGNEFTKIVSQKAKENRNDVVIISANIEAQIAEFENDNEKIELLNELGLKENSLNKLITSGYKLLDLINFFTCGPKETRSWTIKKNTLAPQAAGKIHSDFEKGFIRAETISFDDYIKYKGENASREAGKLKLEGKDYIVKDGDIMHFLFNV